MFTLCKVVLLVQLDLEFTKTFNPYSVPKAASHKKGLFSEGVCNSEAKNCKNITIV